MDKIVTDMEFLSSDHNVSLDTIVKIINKEIQWCYQNPRGVSEEQMKYFIRGLEQARRLIIEAARIMAES
jgi:translation initiation factor 2B subunit (eIF-2B alpha/beta/delta family)